MSKNQPLAYSELLWDERLYEGSFKEQPKMVDKGTTMLTRQYGSIGQDAVRWRFGNPQDEAKMTLAHGVCHERKRTGTRLTHRLCNERPYRLCLASATR